MSLAAAARALDAQASGAAPSRADVVVGALALRTLVSSGVADVELMDAAAGLEALATGGVLELDAHGRARAAVLAAHVRAWAART